MLRPAVCDGEPGALEQRPRGASVARTWVLYDRPDDPELLPTFAWRTRDVAPALPCLGQFLDFWRREIGAMIRSSALRIRASSGRPVS